MHVDLRARRSLGIHWGTFLLTDEPLDQPLADLAAARERFGIEIHDWEGGDPLVDMDDYAAKIAGLVPDTDVPAAAAKSEQSTRVVVVGLVSVASIASFKRHLGRVAGVQSVGVSSGPDGEVVFVVPHGPDVALREACAAPPGPCGLGLRDRRRDPRNADIDGHDEPDWLRQ